MKEKAFRATQIRSMHEMGEMKRVQELRVDEFSLEKLRESHETIQRLTSQVQELQERVRVELQWKFFSRSQSNSRDSKSALRAKLRQTLATRHMESIWITGKRFCKSIHVRHFSHHTHPIEEFINLRHQVLEVRFWCS